MHLQTTVKRFERGNKKDMGHIFPTYGTEVKMSRNIKIFMASPLLTLLEQKNPLVEKLNMSIV